MDLAKPGGLRRRHCGAGHLLCRADGLRAASSALLGWLRGFQSLSKAKRVGGLRGEARRAEGRIIKSTSDSELSTGGFA